MIDVEAYRVTTIYNGCQTIEEVQELFGKRINERKKIHERNKKIRSENDKIQKKYLPIFIPTGIIALIFSFAMVQDIINETKMPFLFFILGLCCTAIMMYCYSKLSPALESSLKTYDSHNSLYAWGEEMFAKKRLRQIMEKENDDVDNDK